MKKNIWKNPYFSIMSLVCLLFLFFTDKCYSDSTLVNEYLASPSTGSVTTKYGTLVNDIYTSKIQNIEGSTRVKGVIVTDGTVQPTLCTINYLTGGTSISTWHGTDTVTFLPFGSLWRGEIDFPVFGRFTRAIVGGFGNATFFSMNWISANNGRDMAKTWIDVVATIGTVTTQLAPVSSGRKYILIVNEGTTNDCYISGSTPFNPTSAGILIAKNNGYWEESKGAYYDAIYAITATGTTSLRLTELK